MYKLKGNAPELSYHVNIAYDGEEQLKALEDVYGPIGSTSLWLERFEKGYFGTVSGEPVVWGKFGTDDTVLQFLDVFKEVEKEPLNEPLLPYTAQHVYDMARSASDEAYKQRKSTQPGALKALFDKVIIPYAKRGYISFQFDWNSSAPWSYALVESFTKKEFSEEMEAGGFLVTFEDADATESQVYSTVRISWDKGEQGETNE